MKDNLTDQQFQFLMTEYKEAATAYYKGLDFGFSTLTAYFTVNGFFAAVVSASADPKGAAAAWIGTLATWIPWVALVLTLTIISLIPSHLRYLENCRLRCEQIERFFTGELFTRMGAIAHSRSSFTKNHAGALVILAIGAAWAYLGFKNADLGNVLRQLLLWWAN